MATKSKKSTKTTKIASARTAKRTSTTAGRTANKKTKCASCKTNISTFHMCTLVALSLCFIITAVMTAVILVSTKLNNDAIAHSIEEDHAKFSSAVYTDETEE